MFRAVCVLATLGMLLVATGCQKKESASSENGASSGSQVQATSGAGNGSSGGSQGSSSGSNGSNASSGSHASGEAHNTEGAAVMHATTGSTILTDIDNGKELHLHPGQTVTVVLESSHANGFAWNMVSPQTPVLSTDAKSVYATSSTSPLGGEETWKFRAAKVGHQDVRLEYGHGKQGVPEKNFRFTAEVE